MIISSGEIETGFDYIELTRDIVKDRGDIYALEVCDDSMIDAFVNSGDLVLMQRQQQVENGDLAAVRLCDQKKTTLRRFFLEDRQVRLQPENPMFSDMYLSAGRVEVLGKVVCVIRQLN